MKIGIGLAQLGHMATGEATRQVATAAESAGFDSVWAIDRLLAPVAPRAPYPGTEDGSLPAEQATALDPVVTLAVAAAMTTRVRLGSSVLVAPWYSPALLARSLASLDEVSGGRLTVGFGLGWSVDEYEAIGLSMRDRGTRLEEMLAVMGALWRDDVVEARTAHEYVAPSVVGLKPRQAPRPPILLATYNAAGLDRIGRVADGWMPTGLPLDVVPVMWQSVLTAAERCGRDAGAMQLVVRADPKVTTVALSGDRPPFVGSRQQIIDDVARVRELGAHELIVDVQGATVNPSELIDRTLELVAGHIALIAA
jgi:probable F420-dependent oxidoreductase